MAKRYSELLKDPRWQKRRLKILERDDWTCQRCNSKVKTLNVHHFKYTGDPWDAADELLISLCEDCHKKEEAVGYSLESIFDVFPTDGILRLDMMDVLIAALKVAEKNPTANKRKVIRKVVEELKKMVIK